MTTHPIEDSKSTTSGPEASTPLEVAPQKWWRRETISRFVKFSFVGGLGVGVNWGFFEVGLQLFAFMGAELAFVAGNVLGLVVSIFTNFVLNDVWTWADRVKGGLRHWFKRLFKYYVSASVAGLVQVVVAWSSKELFWSRFALEFPGVELAGLAVPAFSLGPRLALLTGIACGMIINFLASHLWAFQDAEAE